MKLGVVQWPDNLEVTGPAWDAIQRAVTAAKLDLLVTNELPFGPWISGLPKFDAMMASRSVAAHAVGLDALRTLPVKAVISSRPVWTGDRLANEAFALENGAYHFLHQKHYFPAHSGWYEAEWFRTGRPGFNVSLCPMDFTHEKSNKNPV